MVNDGKQPAIERRERRLPREYGDVFVRREGLLRPAEQRLYMGPPIPHQGTRADDTQLINLFRDCFASHSTHIYTDFNLYRDGKIIGRMPGALEDLSVSKQADRYISNDNLTRKFLDKYYVVPGVRHLREVAGVNDSGAVDESPALSLEDFYRRISANPISAQAPESIDLGTNKVSYLLGDVGLGKSTYVSKLMLRAAQQVDDADGWRLVPVAVDFEDDYKDGDGLLPIDRKFWADLYTKIYIAVQKQTGLADRVAVHEYVTNTMTAPNVVREDILFQIACLSRRLAESKIRLFFIFDNLDRYHFRYTQYSFFPRYADDQMASVRSNVTQLVRVFSKNDLWNAGFCVLFVCREYLYDVISQDGVVSTADNHFGVYRLDATPVSEVVGSRSKLYREALSFLEPKLVMKVRGEYVAALEHLKGKNGLDRLVNAVENPNAAITALDKVGHNGHRSLVKFFSSLSLKYTDTEAWDRLLQKQPSLLLLLYICNNRHRFTQRQNHFPNIFLNDCLISGDPAFPEAHKTHRHSYWLKYLILRYIARVAHDDPAATQRAGAAAEAVTPEKVIRFFARCNGYEDHFVRLMLGSLCTTSEFGCLEIDHYPSHKRLRLTSRARYMIGKDDVLFPGDISQDFCLGFPYLQLAIDDLSLAVPRFAAGEIFRDVDYKYLYYPNARYNPEAADTVIKKLRAVLHFIHILGVSAKKEEELHPEVFADLRAMGVSLDGEGMRRGLLHTAQILLTAMHRHQNLTDIIELDNHLSNDRDLLDMYSIPAHALEVEID